MGREYYWLTIISQFTTKRTDDQLIQMYEMLKILKGESSSTDGTTNNDKDTMISSDSDKSGKGGSKE